VNLLASRANSRPANVTGSSLFGALLYELSADIEWVRSAISRLKACFWSSGKKLWSTSLIAFSAIAACRFKMRSAVFSGSPQF
jgi:hypothetical protein